MLRSLNGVFTWKAQTVCMCVNVCLSSFVSLFTSMYINAIVCYYPYVRIWRSAFPFQISMSLDFLLSSISFIQFKIDEILLQIINFSCITVFFTISAQLDYCQLIYYWLKYFTFIHASAGWNKPHICKHTLNHVCVSECILLLCWNSTAAEARVAWPHRFTSLVGVNHRRRNLDPA